MPGYATNTLVDGEAGGSPVDKDENMANEEGLDSSSRM
jgi:hypothetical protein